MALSIYAKHENAAFKMPWIILILAFPVLGLCIYLVFGHKNVVAKAMRRRFETIEPVLFEQIPQDEAVLERLEEQDFAVANQCRYIKRFGHYPVYRNTDVTFYPMRRRDLRRSYTISRRQNILSLWNITRSRKRRRSAGLRTCLPSARHTGGGTPVLR